MVYIFLVFCLLFQFNNILASSADDYYSSIDSSARDDELLSQLKTLINNHHVLSYDEVWDAFATIDDNDSTDCPATDDIKGLYSMYCWTRSEQCGSFHQEGDCYNREHSWPKSWWGGFENGKNAQTDLFHLYPTDGYVNERRGSLALGKVTSADYESSNGCKMGSCSVDGFTGTCFEVNDDYKGELARSYFYISTCYREEFDCCDEDGVNKWEIKDWMENILREWHHQYPPSDREKTRNELIYTHFQKNRNPYIDHPEWVDQIADF